MFQMTLGDLRRHANCTIEELSEILGIKTKVLIKYEKDSSNIPMDLLLKIEKLYGLPADYIFLGEKCDLKRVQLRNKGK